MDMTVDYSVVIPVYYNADTLRAVFAELREKVLEVNPGRVAEVILVDDGSGDNSWEVILSIQREFPDVARAIRLTRNFGQVSALRAGMRHASGKCVILLSADGQDPADVIQQMLDAFYKGDAEIVIAAREGRDESLYRVWTSRLFYGLMRRLSFDSMPPGGFDFVLLGRRVVDTLLSQAEASPFLQGQILWTGYQRRVLGYVRRPRLAGKSRWGFGKKLTYLIDGVAAYSFAPLRFVSLIGLAVATLGFGYAAVVFISKLAYGNPMKGWAPLMIVLLVLGGAQMFMLGVFGEYLWRILAQVRQRSPYVVAEAVPPNQDEGARLQ